MGVPGMSCGSRPRLRWWRPLCGLLGQTPIHSCDERWPVGLHFVVRPGPGLARCLADLFRRRDRLSLLGEDGLERAALEDGVTLAAAGRDWILGRADDLRGSSVGPD